MPDPNNYKMRSLRNTLDHDGQFYGPSEAPMPVPLALAARIDAARKAQGVDNPEAENELPVVFADAPAPTIPDSVAAVLGTHAGNQADHINTQKTLIDMLQRENGELRAALAARGKTESSPAKPAAPSVPIVAEPTTNAPSPAPSTAPDAAPTAPPANGPTQAVTAPQAGTEGEQSAPATGETTTPTDGPRIRGRANA